MRWSSEGSTTLAHRTDGEGGTDDRQSEKAFYFTKKLTFQIAIYNALNVAAFFF